MLIASDYPAFSLCQYRVVVHHYSKSYMNDVTTVRYAATLEEANEMAAKYAANSRTLWIRTQKGSDATGWAPFDSRNPSR
jgi:hypothetical protein